MFIKMTKCFNTSKLTKTYPVNKPACAICLNSSKNLVNYPCNICKPGAWLICKDCLKECKNRDNRCPVCRTKVIEIIISDTEVELENTEKKKLKCCLSTPNDLTYCQIFHFIFNCISYTIGCIIIGMIIPTTICYNNCKKQTISCTIFGSLCGIMFFIMILIFFRSKKQIHEGIRCIIGFVSSIIFVFTISINGDFSVAPEGFLWLIITLPICFCLSQKSVEI